VATILKSRPSSKNSKRSSKRAKRSNDSEYQWPDSSGQ
jgi:hypothetical protein